MRTPKNVLSKTEHRKSAAGHRQGAGRVPNDALLYQTGPGWMSATPGRQPCGLLNGALRLQILNIYRASSGLRWICDHERRRNEIRKGPARSRNSTASRRIRKSYGARWICESPFTKLITLRGFHKSFPGPVRWVKLYDSNSSFYSPYGPRERFVKAPLLKASDWAKMLIRCCFNVFPEQSDSRVSCFRVRSFNITSIIWGLMSTVPACNNCGYWCMTLNSDATLECHTAGIGHDTHPGTVYYIYQEPTCRWPIHGNGAPQGKPRLPILISRGLIWKTVKSLT